jgi:hypothetical protein
VESGKSLGRMILARELGLSPAAGARADRFGRPVPLIYEVIHLLQAARRARLASAPEGDVDTEEPPPREPNRLESARQAYYDALGRAQDLARGGRSPAARDTMRDQDPQSWRATHSPGRGYRPMAVDGWGDTGLSSLPGGGRFGGSPPRRSARSAAAEAASSPGVRTRPMVTFRVDGE